MKFLILALALSSLSAFAGHFVKEDQGTIEWSINSKTELNAKIFRNSLNLMMEDLCPNQRQMLEMSSLTLFSELGRIGGYYTSLSDFQDERSADLVSKEVSAIINRKMDDLRINFRITSSDIKLFDVNCKQSGIFSKNTNCSARYKNISVVELLD